MLTQVVLLTAEYDIRRKGHLLPVVTGVKDHKISVRMQGHEATKGVMHRRKLLLACDEGMKESLVCVVEEVNWKTRGWY